MSDLIQELLQQRHADKVDGSQLEMLGKRAADMWAEGSAKNLSDAVVQTVKTAGLSPEQVRRVIEFTNVEAYNREFKKEGSPNKVVNFAGGPADPVVIFKDLNDGGGGTVFDRGTSDYSMPPGEVKTAWGLASLFGSAAAQSASKGPPPGRAPAGAAPAGPPDPQHAALAEKYQMDPRFVADEANTIMGFGGTPESLEHNIAYMSALQKHQGGPGVDWDEQRWGRPHPDIPKEKKASVNLRHEREFEQMFATSGGEYPEVNPYGEVIELRDKLASEHDRLTTELSQSEVDFQDLSRRLFGHVKQAALNGHSLAEIVHIWNGIAPDQVFVKIAMESMFNELLDNGVFTGEGMVESLQKIAANRVPNPSHPLVQDFNSYCGCLSKMASVREMRDEVANAVGDLTVFIKAALQAADVGKAIGTGAGKVWDIAGKGGRIAGEAIGGAFGTPEAVASGGKWGARAGKAALLAGGAIGANEAYRRTLKYDPTFQRGVGLLREMTPGTQEYYNKEYQLASGGGGF